ncbi:GDNF family receptor alpha-like [Sphaerodactylus townsendi]|uniref:GDNF family receptor alpha-like n=1 Tax=Sphaerodactylus townsendi TaxID=933632 RepID=UPI0020275BCD|nr:GDNF family receptor alpha-like [Sphaerodactylus townsendi]
MILLICFSLDWTPVCKTTEEIPVGDLKPPSQRRRRPWASDAATTCLPFCTLRRPGWEFSTASATVSSVAVVSCEKAQRNGASDGAPGSLLAPRWTNRRFLRQRGAVQSHVVLKSLAALARKRAASNRQSQLAVDSALLRVRVRLRNHDEFPALHSAGVLFYDNIYFPDDQGVSSLRDKNVAQLSKCNSCAMQESENCHRVVKFLVTELPEFKHCNCTKDACDIQMLLGKECLGNQGKPELSSAPDIQIRFPQPTKLKEIAYPGIFEEDCAMDFKEKDHKNTEAEWESSPLSNAEYKPQHSCFRVQEECVSDTKCNKQFSAYLSDCQVRQTPCRVDQCKRALRNFYLNMPFNVAQKLTFCDCEELDENCLHFSKELLHGKLCTDLVPARSCHSLFQTCQANRLCQEKYKVFTSKCLNDISQSCLENKSCVKYLDTKDFNCSDSDECRRAYIDMWGILRPVKCTYDVRSPVEQSSSFKLFYHIIQRSHSLGFQ